MTRFEKASGMTQGEYKRQYGHYYHMTPPEIKWYAISRSDWMKFIDILKEIKDIPRENMTDEQVNLWDCYYLAKEHGRNERGCLELPFKRWQTVKNAIA